MTAAELDSHAVRASRSIAGSVNVPNSLAIARTLAIGKARSADLSPRVRRGQRRKSRYTVMIKNRSRRHSRPIMDKIIDAFSPLPSHARRSFTFDRGTEFMGHRALEDGIGARSWFCDPNSPWQKGAFENANKRIRRFMPGDTDLATVDQSQLVTLTHHLNSLPRKCLGFRTPAEMFRAHVRECG